LNGRLAVTAFCPYSPVRKPVRYPSVPNHKRNGLFQGSILADPEPCRSTSSM
jgi:hypothetical protein